MLQRPGLPLEYHEKAGIYPINPSEVTDRQIAPSKPFQQLQTEASQDGSASDNPTNDSLFSPDKVELYKKRYEEGYDLDDPSYTAWLKINHPTEVCSNTANSSSLVSGVLSKESRDSGKFRLSSGDTMSEILALTKSKRKPALNAKAICITDDTVLEGLKRKEVEKAKAVKEKEVKRIDRERKKKIREEKQLERERKKVVREEKRLKKKYAVVSSGRKTRSRKNCTQEKGIDDVIAALHLLSSSSDEDSDSSQGDSGEDNTMCPKCGIRYGDSSEKWICCDGCGMWFNKKCTNIKRRVPKVFYCKRCAI